MKTLILATTLALASMSAVASPQFRDDRYYDDRYAAYDTCARCGEVIRINRYGGDGRSTSGGGAVAGALIGGLLGNQVGSGSGRKVATVAGAVAGGVAGNNIERNRRGGSNYEVVVQMDDGRRIVVHQRSLDGVDEGDRVYVSGGRARLL